MQDTLQAKRLRLLHRTITLHAVFGATDDTRNRLLQVAAELTGKKSRTLTAALGDIEIRIANISKGETT
jgi:hypothetical protein